MARELFRVGGFGYAAEDDFVNAVASGYHSRGRLDAIRQIGGDTADLHEGTDGYWFGVPFDFTLDFEGKDHMVQMDETVELGLGYYLRFGVRYGNSHNGFTAFRSPVWVIGLCGGIVNNNTIPRICELIAAKVKQIENVQDQYFDLADELPAYCG